MPATVSALSYHFLRFSTMIMLSLQIPKNLIDIISFSHKSLLHGFVIQDLIIKSLLEALLDCMLFNCSTNAIIGRFAIACCKKHRFSTNTKIILIGTQIHKVLVVFLLSPTTVRKLN